ncbi:DUF3144 domain-containing protein [Teredinibacter purpureus]|uniref:DUF3144 domain-containing protein n=1 Tax=Teredinibacter purpureus TaxID=2731756 RepID=UPI0005F8171D|nr:DUF3144 domain-containing protein [Teredinibacter purpureus]
MSNPNDPALSKEERQFWDAVDSFIGTANEASGDTDAGIVTSAMMYAAARFCAFNLASFSETRKDFLNDSDDSIRHLSSEFKKLLEENMADYGENFKVYLRENDEPS